MLRPKGIFTASLILFLLFVLRIDSKSQNPVENREANERLNRLYSQFETTKNNNVNEKVKYAEEALTLARQLDNKYIQAKVLIYLGRTANAKHNIPDAKKAFSEALQISYYINNELLEAEVLYHYSYYYGFLLSKPDSGLIVLKKSYAIAQSLNDTALLKLASVRLVWMYKQLADPINAIRFSKVAIKYNLNDPYELGEIYNVLTFVYNDSGNPRESIKYFELTLEIAKKFKDFGRLASIYNRMANSYSQLGQYETAIAYHKKAREIFKSEKDTFGVAYTYNMLGMTCTSFNKSNEAIQNYKYAINLFRKLQNEQQLSFCLSNLATEFLKVGKLDSVWLPLSEAIKMGENLCDKLVLTDAYKTAANYFHKKNNIHKAISYLFLAGKYAKEMNNTNFLQEIYDELSKCYSQINDSPNAITYLRLKDEIADTIRKQNADRAVIEMMVKYETAEIKEEVNLSKKNLESLKTDKQTISNILWIVVLASGIVITILFIFYWKKLPALFNYYKNLSRKPFGDRRNIKTALKIFDSHKPLPGKMNIDMTAGILEKLELLMNRDKIFLRPEISLVEVANKLNTNTAYLSRIINDRYGLNFNNYINKYRIEEVKRLIDEHREQTLSYEGISQICGFSSRSSFNQSFKKFTGITPSEYASSKKITN